MVRCNAAGIRGFRDRCRRLSARKDLSRENVDQAAKLLSETTECLSDRYASAEYRANLVRIETTRALLALSS